MVKKQKSQSGFSILKAQGYKEMRIILPLDEERQLKFNNMEAIEVSEEELKSIGKHRWLEVNNGN